MYTMANYSQGSDIQEPGGATELTIKNENMKNREHKLQILNENRGETGLREYAELTAQSDPHFFRWLFDEELKDDFNSSITDDQREEFKQFIDTL